MPTVREITIGLLRQLGMTRIFGNPGSTELPMFRAFPPDFDYVLGLQEATVVGMADGYAQATRNAALVNLHSSAGVGHALGNIFTAYRNQAPIVVTAGQQARSILPFDPFLHAERPTEFPRPFVKWACEPARAADVPRALLRAYLVAMTPPCGPTFVSVPVDDWDQQGEPVAPRTIVTRQSGDPEALAELARQLRLAERPALVFGAGVARDQGWAAGIALAETLASPVYVAPFAARNVFPEDHALFGGFLRADRASIVDRLADHDFVLVTGGPLNLYHTEGTGPHLPEAASLAIIDDNPAILSGAPGGKGILANSAAALATLGGLVGPNNHSFGVRDAPPPTPSEPGGITDRLLMRRIAALRPVSSVIVEEAPSSRAAMQEVLPITQPDGFYTTASGGLGYALPAAVGVALARANQRVIAIIGDGSAMYSIQALFTAASLHIPLSVIVIVNRRYAALDAFGRHFDLDQVEGAGIDGLDFCALATGMGVASVRVTDADDLDAALAWSFAANQPTLIEILTARSV